MLGIRRYRGAAIDLWQGESRLFVRDYTAVATIPGLAEADRLGHRHVVIEVAPQEQQGGEQVSAATQAAAAKAMRTVMEFLASNRAAPQVKRITFVIPDAAQYGAYQQELFSTFPDSDS